MGRKPIVIQEIKDTKVRNVRDISTMHASSCD